MRARTLGTCTKLLVVLTAVTFLATIASAQVNGAIYTTNSDGTTVNGNIYPSKDAVYLSGGPQNKNDNGLVPADGFYYFQVTDPSGANLLSLDNIKCRVVVVANGRVHGVPSDDAGGFGDPSCYHTPGTADDFNGALPVQLCNPDTSKCPTDFADTPNPGSEYKAWMTPVTAYVGPIGNCPKANNVYGFCDDQSKTDNFKVKKAEVGFVVVCKFNDLNGSGTQDVGEPLIPFWPINATGVDTLSGPLGTVHAQTDVTGCVSFSVSTFPNQDNTDTVLLTETVLPDWLETAPLDGTSGPISVFGFVETITVKAGDVITAPNFGNFCISTACGGQGLVVTKDANPSLTRTFQWEITKSVDNALIKTAGGAPATFNYTVGVKHDAGTDSGWKVTGTIKVSNPNPVDISGVNVSDAVDNGGACTLSGNVTGITVPANSEVDVPYTCTYDALPAAGTNTATAAWDSSTASGTANIDFTNAAIHAVDGCVDVTDSLGGSLGKACLTDQNNPTTFTYSKTFADQAGTCTSHDNTATFTTNDTGATGSASQTVKDCQGADLQVSKTATPSFTRTYTWNITKAVDKTLVEQIGGTATFNYTVVASQTGFVDSAWKVTGTITVSNPNDWEAITANVSDAVDDGGSCPVTGGTGVSVPASGAVTLNYTCTYALAPSPSSGTNTATASWIAATFSTPHGSAQGTAGFTFGAPTTTVNKTITVADTFNGVTTTLGTLTATDSAPFASATYKYSHTVNVPANNCVSYTNTAKIVETGQTASQTVEICGPAKTGALTMGFWQNKNGQAIITGQAKTGVCPSATWLRQFAPFLDLSATATCAQVGTYVTNIIKAANASGASMNAMLKAQMLATSLDVYFGGGPGGNPIGAPTVIGNDVIDLTKICHMIDSSGGTGSCSGAFESVSSAFGGATKLPIYATGTISGTTYTTSILLFQNTVSNSGGSTWYGQVKATQGLAKDTFDAINNGVAFAP